jgi:hypothetical protein
VGVSVRFCGVASNHVDGFVLEKCAMTTDLIKRLTEAGEGSANFDKELSRFDNREPAKGPLRHRYTRRFTDASYLLPPGLIWEAYSEDDWSVLVMVRQKYGDGDVVAACTHRSAELALCIAILTAREKNNG